MEKVRALHTITETVDILRMLEELLALPPERMNATLAGMRLTVRSARERLNMSHEALGRELLAQVKAGQSTTDAGATPGTSAISTTTTTEDSLIMRRRDLRSAMERNIERPTS